MLVLNVFCNFHLLVVLVLNVFCNFHLLVVLVLNVLCNFHLLVLVLNVLCIKKIGRNVCARDIENHSYLMRHGMCMSPL